jgi:hypothetical protein
MNRHQRRRQAALRAMTRASRGVFSVNFYDADGVRELMRAAENRDLQAVVTLRKINDWLEAAATQPPGRGPQCLTCPREMAGQTPLLFGAIMPFAASDGVGVSVGGLCVECALIHPDPLWAAMEAWRAIWPDLRVVEGGHA